MTPDTTNDIVLIDLLCQGHPKDKPVERGSASAWEVVDVFLKDDGQRTGRLPEPKVDQVGQAGQAAHLDLRLG